MAVDLGRCLECVTHLLESPILALRPFVLRELLNRLLHLERRLELSLGFRELSIDLLPCIGLDSSLPVLPQLGRETIGVRRKLRPRDHLGVPTAAQDLDDEAIDQIVIAPAFGGGTPSRIDATRDATRFWNPEAPNPSHHGLRHELREPCDEGVRPGTRLLQRLVCVYPVGQDERPRGGVESRRREVVRVAFEGCRNQAHVAAEDSLESGTMLGVGGQNERNDILCDLVLECSRHALVEALEIDPPTPRRTPVTVVDGTSAAAAPTVVLQGGLGELASECFLETGGKGRGRHRFEGVLVAFEEGDTLCREHEHAVVTGAPRGVDDRAQLRGVRDARRFTGRIGKTEDSKARVGRPEGGARGDARGGRSMLAGEARECALGLLNLARVGPECAPALQACGYGTGVSYGVLHGIRDGRGHRHEEAEHRAFALGQRAQVRNAR